MNNYPLCTIKVKVLPRGKENQVIGLYGEFIKIRIKSPPIEGKANQMLVEFLSEELKISQRQIQILRGHTNQEKILQIAAPGLTRELILKKLGI